MSIGAVLSLIIGGIMIIGLTLAAIYIGIALVLYFGMIAFVLRCFKEHDDFRLLVLSDKPGDFPFEVMCLLWPITIVIAIIAGIFGLLCVLRENFIKWVTPKPPKPEEYRYQGCEKKGPFR